MNLENYTPLVATKIPAPSPQDPPDDTQKALLAVIKEQSAALTIPDAAEREIARMKKKSQQFANGLKVSFFVMGGAGVAGIEMTHITGIMFGTLLAAGGAALFCTIKSLAWARAAELERFKLPTPRERRTDLLRKAGKTLLAEITPASELRVGQVIVFPDPENPNEKLGLRITDLTEMWERDESGRANGMERITARLVTIPPLDSHAESKEIDPNRVLRSERPLRSCGPTRLVNPVPSAPAGPFDNTYGR